MDVVVPSTAIDGNDVGSDTEWKNLLTVFDELTAPEGPSVNPTETHPAVALREIAAENLMQQANRMILRARGKLPKVVVGDNVALPLPEFDRGRGDPANIIGVVMEEKDGKFKIGIKHGAIENFMERNSFDLSIKISRWSPASETLFAWGQLVVVKVTNDVLAAKPVLINVASATKMAMYECNSACHPNNSNCCNKDE